MVKNIINCIEFCIKVMKQMINFRQPELDANNFRQDVIREIQIEENKEQTVSRSGFTLAEMLVVIGIIGVVSALTLPNLNQNINNKEVVVRVLKARATIEEAYARAIATYGAPGTWASRTDTSATNAFKIVTNRIMGFISTSKSCGYSTSATTDCWKSTTPGGKGVSYILSDGTAIRIQESLTSASDYRKYNFSEIDFYIDVDGPNKGLNKAADDVYALRFNRNGKLSGLTIYGGNPLVSHNVTNPFEMGAWIIQNENTDFMNLSGNSLGCFGGNRTLGWGGNITCK